jgi:transposase InsO family protein
MNIHSSARTCVASRGLLVQRVRAEGWSVKAAAAAAGVSVRTAYKWLERFRDEGMDGLRDRSSRPSMVRGLSQKREQRVLELRRQRRTILQISTRLGLARSTVARMLSRHGLSRLSALEPAPVIRRYERAKAGELLHIDTKKLGRIRGIGHRIVGLEGRQFHRNEGIGWDYVHVAIDDASRLAYVEVLGDERIASSCGFLRRAVEWFAGRGVTIQRVMSDNGSSYRSRDFAALCAELGVRHLRTRPYTPRTNGKAERFIQTLLREWAYARPYVSSAKRNLALDRWLPYYNLKRPHSALHHRPPITRIEVAA